MGYWNEEGASEALQIIYPRILGRVIDSDGYNSWKEQLVKGSLSMKDVILSFIESDEYRQKFDDPYRCNELWGNIIRFMYQQLLARSPETQTVELAHSEPLRSGGRVKLAKIILKSAEYSSRWGNNGVPGIGYNKPPGIGGVLPQQPKQWQLCVYSVNNYNDKSIKTEWGYTPVDAAITLQSKLSGVYVEPNPPLPW